MGRRAMRWKAQPASGLVSHIKAKQIFWKIEPTDIISRSSELKIIVRNGFLFLKYLAIDSTVNCRTLNNFMHQ